MNTAVSVLQNDYKKLGVIIGELGYAVFNGYTQDPEEKDKISHISLCEALVTLSECQRERREILKGKTR